MPGTCTLTMASSMLLAGAPALAQPAPYQPPPPADRSQESGAVHRSLNGHVFTPGLLIRSPFAVTTFQADLLYGTGSGKGPTYDADGNITGEATYTFAAMTQSFAYDKRVLDDVSIGNVKILDGVAVGLGAITQLYSGVDGPSAIVVGAEVEVGAFGRATAGRRFGPFQAALTFDASYAPRMGIQVIDAIRKALDERILDASAAFSQTNAWTLKPGVAMSWAPFRAIGLTASADYQWVSLDTVEANNQEAEGYDVAVAADLDLGAFTSVPLSLLGTWRGTEPLGANGVSRVTDVSVGAYYTGRPALALGLELARRDLTVTTLDTSIYVAQIRLQYVW